jgi:hypothetical protein
VELGSWEQALKEGGAVETYDDHVLFLRYLQFEALRQLMMKEWERKLKVRKMTAIQRMVG